MFPTRLASCSTAKVISEPFPLNKSTEIITPESATHQTLPKLGLNPCWLPRQNLIRIKQCLQEFVATLEKSCFHLLPNFNQSQSRKGMLQNALQAQRAKTARALCSHAPRHARATEAHTLRCISARLGTSVRRGTCSLRCSGEASPSWHPPTRVDEVRSMCGSSRAFERLMKTAGENSQDH